MDSPANPRNPGLTTWSLRRATEDDRTLLYEMNRVTMRSYVEAVWGWDETFQLKFFDEHFRLDGTRQIIEVDGRAVGMIEVVERPEDFLLVSIRVLPDWQDQGIGTSVIRSVIDRATAAKKPVALKVLKMNVRAQELYRRLGFPLPEKATFTSG